jgi:hypothetical protein
MSRNSILHRVAVCLPTVLLFLSTTALATAKTARYKLDEHTTERGVILRLYDRVTQRTLWKRFVEHAGKAGWSPDGRTLVLAVIMPDRTSDIRLMIWRKGHQPYIHPRYIPGDDVMNFVWSPDHKRLLLRVGMSGDFDINVGSFYALELPRRRIYQIASGVRKMVWWGPHKVCFWTVKEIPLKHPMNGGSLQTVTDPAPHFWHCP